jgi:hypothetical protein
MVCLVLLGENGKGKGKGKGKGEERRGTVKKRR